MLAILAFIVIGITSTLFLVQSRKKDPKKIFDVYSQPGKWFYLKYYTFILVLTLRKWKSKLVKSKSGLGVHAKSNLDDLEKLQPLSNHEKAFDAVFFQAVNKDGYYLCGGVERRHEGKANALLYLVVPELGLLRCKNLPYTLVNQDPDLLHLVNKYSAGGIHFEPIEAMKTWDLTYSGQMTLKSDPETLIDVHLQAEWTNDKFPYFFYDTQLSLEALARAIAREEWNKSLFDNLKAAHQCHYEQMGKLIGKLTVNGKEETITMDAFRDHSFGYKRDWSLMHRYAFHMIYLENGMRACIGVICQPCTTSHLEVGYVALANKTVHPIDSCDLLLYQHGEKGRPGKNIGFSFTANREIYDVQVTTEHECEHFKGNDTEARLIERFVSYEVNGVKGRGISEWQYKNV